MRAAPIIAVLALLFAGTGVAEDAPVVGATIPLPVLNELAAREAAAGHHQAALALYEQVLERDPGNAEARSALTALRAHGERQPSEPRIVVTDAGAQTTEGLRHEAALAAARMALTDAELMAANGRAEAAATLLDGALAALRKETLTPTVAASCARMEALIAAWRIPPEAAPGRQRTLAEAQQQRGAGQAAARDRLHGRIARIIALEQHGHLELALAACRPLLREYPAAAEPRALFARLLAASHDQRRMGTGERQVELEQEILHQVERSLIPEAFDGDPDFASDWGERHRELAAPLSAPLEPPAWEEALRERLAGRISLTSDGLNAVEVLKALALQSRINLVIDPSVIAADQTITLRADHLSLANALSWICRQIDTSWNIADGAIYIGPRRDEAGVMALYDVGEALFQVRDQVPRWELGLPTGGGAGAGTGAPAGTAIAAAPDAENAEPAVAPEDLVDLIRSAVSPATWQNPAYGIEIRRTSLLVTAPRSVHLLIQQLLRSRSHTAKLLVQVKTSWLNIDDGYLEEIGVDWSTSGSLLRAPGTGISGYHRTTSAFDHQGDLLNRLPATATDPQPPAFGTGLNLSAIMIGATQLSAILTAVERNQRATTISETSVTTYNGVRGYSLFGRTYSYIGDYAVGPGAGGGGNGVSPGADPHITSIMLGGLIDVKPYVSADRKYVTMEMTSSLATLEGVLQEGIRFQRNFQVGFDPNANGGMGAPINQQVTENLVLELPTVLLDKVRTNVMIPDGGTLMVGGFSHHMEQSTAARIPVLGDIPFLGRLFGQRGRYSQRKRLMLLVSVHIIDYDEWEAKQ
jgi:type II secretory pathway component GspD/PulD (secretin)